MTRRTWYLVVALLILAAASRAFAQEHRTTIRTVTPNVGARCAWAVLDSLLAHNGYRGLTPMAMPAGDGSTYAVTKYLKDNNVDHEVRYVPSFAKDRMAKIREACKANRGCMVSILPFPMHAICVVGVSDTHVCIIDPNEPGRVQQWAMADFQRQWYGLVFTMRPRGVSP